MSLRSAWRTATGRRTRRYNKLSDIAVGEDINELDPDDISKQILKDPDLTPRRGRKLNVLLNIRDAAKKQGKTGRDLKNEVKSMARRKMQAKKEEEAAVDRMMKQINDEIDLETSNAIRKSLPDVPMHEIKPNKSASQSATKGGKRRSSKNSRRKRRR
jgi:hypothetical protein